MFKHEHCVHYAKRIYGEGCRKVYVLFYSGTVAETPKYFVIDVLQKFFSYDGVAGVKKPTGEVGFFTIPVLSWCSDRRGNSLQLTFVY